MLSSNNQPLVIIIEEKVFCKPLIQSEIDSSVTPISALFG